MWNHELLAVVIALQEWRHWLEGAALPFPVWTDQHNLVYLRSAKCLNSCQARRGLFLGRLQFTLSYRPGSHNTKLDMLPRQFSHSDEEGTVEPILPPKCVVAVVRRDIDGSIRAAQRTQPPPNDCSPNRIFVPDTTRSQVLQCGHSSKPACHPGFLRTHALV